MLSAVPSQIYSLNEGLMTLQFMSVSVNPLDPTGEVQGGTQDNGTWLYDGNTKVWNADHLRRRRHQSASTSAIRHPVQPVLRRIR